VALIGLLAATATAAPIIDNDEIYIWGDPFGDQFDNYAEVTQGETIMLEIWVNDLDGSYDMLYEQYLSNNNWTHAANGARTGVWWDTAVIDGPSVFEDRTGNYYSSYWGSTGYNQHLAHYWTKHYDDWGQVRWVAENRMIISMSFTVREDAPVGPSQIGLEQGFFWSNNIFDPYGGYFFWDRLDVGDTYAMTLMVLPDGVEGDFDGDGDVDADDIDILCANMGGDLDPYDVNDDGIVDEDDMVYHVENLVEYDSDDDGTPDGNGTYRGDFNLDGVVNATDLQLMKGSFGTSGVGYAGGNANCDTVVNATDLQILKGSFGSSVTGVPEPLTVGLLAVGGAALLRRRK